MNVQAWISGHNPTTQAESSTSTWYAFAGQIIRPRTLPHSGGVFRVQATSYRYSVKLAEVKVVFSVGALMFEGDLSASIFHLQLIVNQLETPPNCKLYRAIVQPIIFPKLGLARPPWADHISARATRNN
jgi:hypothetical protein